MPPVPPGLQAQALAWLRRALDGNETAADFGDDFAAMGRKYGPPQHFTPRGFDDRGTVQLSVFSVDMMGDPYTYYYDAAGRPSACFRFGILSLGRRLTWMTEADCTFTPARRHYIADRVDYHLRLIYVDVALKKWRCWTIFRWAQLIDHSKDRLRPPRNRLQNRLYGSAEGHR